MSDYIDAAAIEAAATNTPETGIFKDPEQEREIVKKLSEGYDKVVTSDIRARMLVKLEKWRRQREARPEQEEKDFPWPKACLTEDADILTEIGWKSVRDIRNGERVLSREPMTGNLNYEPVQRTFDYSFDGDLIRLENLFFDITVTPNHRFPLESPTKPYELSAEEIFDGFPGQTHWKLPLTGKWTAEPATSLWGYNPTLFMEFLGWYISEGWCYKNRCVGISQTKPDNRQRIERLLKEMDVGWKPIVGGYLVNLEDSLVAHLRDLGRAWEKYIPRMYLELPPEQLQSLFDALILGDGSTSWGQDKHRNFPTQVYATTSERLAGDIQELALKLGFSGSVTKNLPKEGGKIRGRQITSARPCYVVGMRFTKQTRFRQDRAEFTKVPYRGRVYCVDVPPYHTIYVRQNGLPLWTMNSNVTPPLALTNTNAMFARLNLALAKKKPFWVVHTEDAQLRGQAKAASALLDALSESPDHINLRAANRTILYDYTSLGTQFVKIPWITERWNFKRRTPEGGVKTVNRIRRDSPMVVPVRLENFITQPYWWDLQRAPWIQEEVWLMEHEVKQRIVQGVFNENAEDTLKRGADEIPEERKETLERMGISVSEAAETGMYRILQAHSFEDVDEDGVPEDIIMWYDPFTGQSLRSEYNSVGVREYARMPYLDRPYELYAVGVGWIVEPLQEEIEALHNMRIDGNMLSMLQMYVTRRGAMAPNERFRPLKAIAVDNPKEDFIPVKFPEVGYGNLQSEMLAKEYADRGVMASDSMLGFENRATSARTTATGTMFLAGQGAQTYEGAVMETVKDVYAEIGRMLMFQLIANKERTKDLYYLVPRDMHADLDALLDTEIEEIPTKFSFRIWTTDTQKSEEQKQRSMLSMVQLYTFYAQQIFQLLPVALDQTGKVPPRIREVAMKFVTGGTAMLEQVFEGLGEADVEKFLPYVRDFQMFLTQIEQQRDRQLTLATQTATGEEYTGGVQ